MKKPKQHTIHTIFAELCSRAAKMALNSEVDNIIEAGIDQAIVAMLDEYATRPVMLERGTRARLVEEISRLHNATGREGAPANRPSVDRWLKPMYSVGDDTVEAKLVPTLPKFLLLALAIENVTAPTPKKK